MIYIASPYQHTDPQVMEWRFEQACFFAGKRMNLGEFVYSPIVHNHPIAVRMDLPRGWDYWQKYDTDFLQRSSAVYVLCLPDWGMSKGIKAELGIAKSLDLHVTYFDIHGHKLSF